MRAVMYGAGNIGRALCKRMNFDAVGFELVAIFDNSPEVIGREIGDLKVDSTENLESFCRENNITAAIVCVPKFAAKDVIENLISLDINIFWNFTPYDILLNHPDEKLAVENVHLKDSLMTLKYLTNDVLD